MKITIISVGKIKEKFYREAIAEYAKRLSSYCKFEIIELQDEKTPDKASAETERLIKEKEAERIMKAVDEKLEANDVEGAKDICRDTRGPVASICYQALLHIKEPLEQIDRQLTNYGTVQIGKMEKGCTWIRLFIAVAPSLGFLGTVIGMVMAFDQIQTAGDISPTIVAKGMKVALITTIFGIVVAIVLQFFYNYILAKIERLTAHMEECAITLMDSVTQYKSRNNG